MGIKRRSISALVPVAVAAAIAIWLYLGKDKPESSLPVYQPNGLNPEYVHPDLRHIRANHRIGDFSLIDQDGDTIGPENFQGKLFVADFFFTRCPSICPVMSRNMEKLQAYFREEPMLKLLSISVTPEYDSIAVLKAYANEYQAIQGKWHLCTGDKEHIYDLARKQFFAVTDEGDGLLQDFIHSPNFILVDPDKRIRGVYDGTKDEELERIISDIEKLLESEYADPG
ncbi:SCO family protein [Poritiphilus flavus]|uniref:SCO family protein n=1 Tax=Poritiphilus flavus TaxID=2697053 RepID=A0A6L9EBA5_9FLAO|nr:SCO family protein [Poritiphilus flavus]NAS12026.1 SCO family protein [Poritiphilus flavus]